MEYNGRYIMKNNYEGSRNLFFREYPELSGVFNYGTGQSHTFNQFMQAIIDYSGKGGN